MRLLPLRLAAACRQAKRRTSNSSCRPATSATSWPGGCSRRWACRSAASRWRRTRTTSSTGCSRPASTASAPVRPSLAPSMDIQVASNFERFLYYSRRPRSGARAGDHADVQGDRRLPVRAFRRATCFTASRCTDAEISGDHQARSTSKHGYVCDPHTACGFEDLDPDRVSVVLATASPAKFPEAIRAAIGIEPTHPALEALKSRPVVKHAIRADPRPSRPSSTGTGSSSPSGLHPPGC